MRNSRFFSVALVLVGLGGSGVFALDPIGPPSVDLKRGQLGAQIGYSYTNMDLELSDGEWSERIAGIFQDAGKAIPITIKDFEVHKAYAGLEFGADDNGTAFLRLGATRAKFGDSIWNAGEELEGSTDFTVGGGLKATLLDRDNLKLGVVIQANWSKFDGVLGADNWFTDDIISVELAEFQIAAGATHEWSEGRWIYGGPFVLFIKGEFEDTFTELRGTEGPIVGSTLSDWEYSWQIDQGPVYGFFLGVKLQLTEDSIFNIEYQYSSDASAFGASLMLPY